MKKYLANFDDYELVGLAILLTIGGVILYALWEIWRILDGQDR